MSKKFPEFYVSQKWKLCRNAYMKSVHGLCEDCKERGIIRPAEIVHHKIELTQENISDPNISLSFSNLKAVCRSCHLMEHGFVQRRYKALPDGRIIPLG